MEKKTIIFIQNIDFPQQWAVDIFYYAKFLSKEKNINVKVIVSEIKEDISHENLEVIPLGNTNYFSFIIRSFQLLKKYNKNQKIDYVYFFAQHPFSVILQFFTKYFLKIDTIYDVVSWPIWKGLIPFISKWTIKLGVYLSNKYIILDEWLINKLSLSNNKFHGIIWMWYDQELFFENKNINLFNKKEKDIIFTYIWTLNFERNLDIFIKAFIENINDNKNIKLYFIWSWSAENKLKEISWKFLKKNIFFLWVKDHKKIPDYINSSDIMVSYIPKVDFFEYQPPTKIIEYLACNKPLIATNTIAQCEILKWYEELIHEDDFDSTKKKIWIMITQNIKWNHYSLLVKKYNWIFLIKKIKELI